MILIRTKIEQTKKEFDKKFSEWKFKNDGRGTQEQYLLYLLASTDGGHDGTAKSKNCT